MTIKPEPLSLTVHSVDTPDLADAVQLQARRTRLGRFKMLLVLLVCAAPVVGSYLSFYVIRPESRSNYGSLILPTRSLPALKLQALDSSAVDAHSLRGQWLLLALGPAACDSGCERRLYMQRQLREMLGRESDRLDKVWLLTDAGTPKPELMAGIESGAPALVLRADRAALAAWLVPEAAHALEDHLYLVDPRGEWMMRWPSDAEPGRVKRDLDRLLRAASSWDKAGR